jgi:hypothetical protein
MSTAEKDDHNPDIVARLRSWVHAVDAVSASDLMDEAATVIEVQRCCTSACRYEIAHLRRECRATAHLVADNATSCGLTDTERSAIKEAADAYEQNNGDPDCERIADTLHGLLDRLCHGGPAYTGGVSAASETKVADPQPTLTDAEREAIEYFSKWCVGASERLARYNATLRGLLGRLGGGA